MTVKSAHSSPFWLAKWEISDTKRGAKYGRRLGLPGCQGERRRPSVQVGLSRTLDVPGLALVFLGERSHLLTLVLLVSGQRSAQSEHSRGSDVGLKQDGSSDSSKVRTFCGGCEGPLPCAGGSDW